MSERPTTSTEAIVYVRLLDEGSDVWRPVQATRSADGSYELGIPAEYDPETEAWEFPPRAQVRCVLKSFADGEVGLVAVASA